MKKYKIKYIDKKFAGYCGSLLQTKISEPAKGTYIKWEWNGKDYIPTVHQLNNIYSTITLDVDNIDNISTEAKEQHIIIKYDSNKITKSEALKIKKEIQEKFPNKIEIRPNVKRKVNILNETSNEKEKNKIDLKNVFTDYLNSINLNSTDINSLMNLEALYTSNLDISKDFELGDFSLCFIEISNFLSFAPHTQIINVDKDGIIGIGGENRVGKSSIIKAIMFCLFNSSPDNNSSLKKLINKHNRSKEAFVNLILSKNGKFYKISRSLIPKKTGVTTILKFYETDEFGNEIKSLTDEKRQVTEKEIQKYFGIESSFEILSLYSAQKRQQELIDCKKAERLKLVNRFIGLHTYELKLEAVNEDLKAEKITYNLLAKDFNQSADIKKMETDLISYNEKEIELKAEVNDLQESERIYEFKNRHLVSAYELNKKLASKIVSNPEEVKTEINTLNKYITEKKKYKIEIENNIELFKTDKDIISTKWNLEYSTDISKHKIEWRKLSAQVAELAVITSEIEKANVKSIENECSNCGQEITSKMKEKIIIDLNLKKERKEYLTTIISDYEIKCKEQETLQDEYSDIKDKIEQCESEIKKVSIEIKNAETQIENLQLKTKDWDEVQLAKERLNELEKEYLKYQLHKTDSEKTLEMLQNDLGSIKTMSQLLQKDIIQYKNQYDKLLISEEKIRVLKLYKDLVNKDGLPLYILKSKMNEINEQVNLIVSQIFDFEVEFSVDESSGELNIDFFYENDEEKNDVGFASGSETFIINLCIKVGLSQVSELPKLNSLLIDEGYGTLDKDTINKIPALFTVLPEYYKNIITISHIDELKDLYQYEIKLKKIGKYTEVIF